MNWMQQGVTAPRGIEVPRTPIVTLYINDVTGSVYPGVRAAGYSFQVLGANVNRVYLLLQNNTASANISIAVGNSASSTGILIVPGGYYEREIYSFISSVFITLLGATTGTDYITYEEGSSVRG